MSYLLSCLIGYLVGAIPFGLLITFVSTGKDVREFGSGNIGATNTLRVAGKGAAILTLACDFLKSFLLIWLAKNSSHNWFLAHLSLFVVLGHIFPIWLKFKGGKGVATALGVYWACDIYLGIIALATWLTIFIISRYSSLSSIIMVIVSSIVIMSTNYGGNYSQEMKSALLIIGIVIILRHYQNIIRLVKGQEKKISLKGL